MGNKRILGSMNKCRYLLCMSNAVSQVTSSIVWFLFWTFTNRLTLVLNFFTSKSNMAISSLHKITLYQTTQVPHEWCNHCPRDTSLTYNHKILGESWTYCEVRTILFCFPILFKTSKGLMYLTVNFPFLSNPITPFMGDTFKSNFSLFSNFISLTLLFINSFCQLWAAMSFYCIKLTLFIKLLSMSVPQKPYFKCIKPPN